MNRILSTIKALIAIAMLWPLSAWAYTGSGTADAPYLVNTWADLKDRMAAGGYIQLTGDCTDPNPTNSTYLIVLADKTVTLDLNGHTIDRNLSGGDPIENGFVIKASWCTLTIKGPGVITGGNNYSNNESKGGGGILIYNGNLKLQGCTISNNKVSSDDSLNGVGGGGVCFYTSAKTYTFTMEEGTNICNNTTMNGNGGGIKFTVWNQNSPVVNINGGTIEKNTCSGTGGGIIFSSATFNLCGSPLIRENKKGDLDTGTDNNVYLGNVTINITDELTNTVPIGLIVPTWPRLFTSGLEGRGSASCFKSDDIDNYTISTGKTQTGNKTEAKIIGYWEDLKNKLSGESPINITLERDITALSGDTYLSIAAGKTVSIDLNGHTINRNLTTATNNGYIFYVASTGSLTIRDSSGDNSGTITGGYTTSSQYYPSGGIYNQGTLILHGGTITGNTCTYSDGAGGVYNKGNFTMYGGIITNNTCSRQDVHYNDGSMTVCGGTLNVFLPSGKTITIGEEFDSSTLMGVYVGSTGSVITSGLNSRGTAANFQSLNSYYSIFINSEGEAQYGQLQDIKVEIYGQGSVTTSPTGKAPAGSTVTITSVVPGDGYYLSGLRYSKGSSFSSVDLNTMQFPMQNSTTTLRASFSQKTNITPSVTLSGWTYGDDANAPTVEGNTGNGDVTYLYKVKDADDNTYTETVPTTVGTYTVKATVAESTQYFGATATTDFTITKRPVTITSGITANNKTYDGTTDAAIGTANAVFDGKIESDGLTVSTTGTFADKDVGTGKTVNLGELTLGGTSVDNYKLAESGHQTTTTANITPLLLTVTADNATKTYGEENPPFTIQYSGFLSGEDETTALTTLPTATCEATISSNVGSYNIVPDNGVATNYTFNYVSGILTINPKSLTEAMVTISNESTVYNGNSQKPTIALEDADANCTITENDYHISNDGSGTDVGTYSVVINGTNNYYGTVTKSDCFEITPKSIAGVSIAAIEDQTYTGNAITPATVITDTGISPVPTLTENTDYTLSYSTNNTNVTGENVTITITGKGNYDSSTSTSTTFLIVRKALEDGMIAAIADQAYTGSDIEPELVVTYNGMNLSRDTHYTAAFDNNTNTTGSGTATVTITACDNSNYSGTASASFSIVAADLSTAEVTGTSKNVDFGSSTSPAIDPLAVNFPAADYTIVYRKTYQPPIVDVTTIPTDIIGTYKVVLKPTDTGNLTGEKVTDYVVNVQLPVILKQCEWVTYFDERFDLATPSGYQAYKVSAAAVSGVTLEAIDYIPKGVPVILKTTASGISETTMNVKFDEQQETSEIIGDVSFIGVPSTATDGVLPDGTAYILVSDEFILFEGTEAIPKHRCYLKFASAGTRSIGISIEGEGTTGIDSSEIQRKEMGHWYDLQGRRIEKPTQKGIYIKDGKKIVIGKEVRL